MGKASKRRRKAKSPLDIGMIALAAASLAVMLANSGKPRACCMCCEVNGFDCASACHDKNCHCHKDGNPRHPKHVHDKDGAWVEDKEKA